MPTVHAAVFAINEAIDKGQAEGTMQALNNPNAMLRNTQSNLAQEYQDALSRAKKTKEDQASGRVKHSPRMKSFNSPAKLVKINMLSDDSGS